jgi:hypothetical protein
LGHAEIKPATRVSSLFIFPVASLLIAAEEFPDISAIQLRLSAGIAK